MKHVLEKEVRGALSQLGLKAEKVALEAPADFSHGDYSTNVALSIAKNQKIQPQEIARKIVEILKNKKIKSVEKIEVAGIGFINFFLSKKYFADEIGIATKTTLKYGRNSSLKGEKILIEYTDPNPFKEFHIGHLMSNAIGESLSRIIEAGGAKVKRACYQGDVGLHVAKAMYGMLAHKKDIPKDSAPLSDRISFLGKVYTYGANQFEADEKAKTSIYELNKKNYTKSDKEINKLYEAGKKWSLLHFEEVYKKLGTEFDFYFMESEAAPVGMFLVEEFLKKGVFEKSEGAIIFKGEKYGLHTRVFINSQGFPTYEAKELGLVKLKSDRNDFDRSIIVTGNDIKDYFQVFLKVVEFVLPTEVNKIFPVTHGMLRLSTGKMASRKGNVITGESLIRNVEEKVLEKIKDRNFDEIETREIAEIVAIGAIKFSILKQSPGKDIIFDFDKSLSLEGDSGPYLQYAYVRAKSVLEKAKKEKIKESVKSVEGKVNNVERLISRFGDIVERAREEYAPQLIVQYLLDLSSAFNHYYSENQIVDKNNNESPYRIALTRAFMITIQNGLDLLGIRVPERM